MCVQTMSQTRAYHFADMCPLRNAAYLYVDACSGKILDAKDPFISHVFDYLPEQLVGLSVSVLFRQSDMIQQSLDHFIVKESWNIQESSSIESDTLKWARWSHKVASLVYPTRLHASPRYFPTQHHVFEGCTSKGHTVWFDACIHIQPRSSLHDNTDWIAVWLVRDVTEYVFYSHVTISQPHPLPSLVAPVSSCSSLTTLDSDPTLCSMESMDPPMDFTTVFNVNRYGLVDHAFPPAFLDYDYEDLVSQSLMKYVHKKDISRLLKGMDYIIKNKSGTFCIRWAMKKMRSTKVTAGQYTPLLDSLDSEDILVKRTNSQFSLASVTSLTSMDSNIEDVAYPKLRTDSFTYYYSDDEDCEQDYSCNIQHDDSLAFVWVQVSGKVSENRLHYKELDSNMSNCPQALLLSLRTLDTEKAALYLNLKNQDMSLEPNTTLVVAQPSRLWHLAETRIIQPAKLGWHHMISLLDQALEWLETYFIHLRTLVEMLVWELKQKTLPSNCKECLETDDAYYMATDDSCNKTPASMPANHSILSTTIEKVGALVMNNTLCKSLFDMALSHGLVPRVAFTAFNLN